MEEGSNELDDKCAICRIREKLTWTSTCAQCFRKHVGKLLNTAIPVISNLKKLDHGVNSVLFAININYVNLQRFWLIIQ